ncbi:MAG: ribonuclease Z [Propionibacteriaceae bacterium]|jgi:ribonuclease Z|nr:ribonuclease Z [Propionibacteriaceae bacterium]
MELTFLGTAAGVPSPTRNVSSIGLNLIAENGSVWLVDAGEGAQLQLMKTAITPRRITRIFITHLHGDHLFGLPGLLSTRSFHQASPLNVYGPVGIASYVETSLRLSGTHLTYPCTVHEIPDDQTLFHADGFTVRAVKLDHVVPCFGYRFEEDARPGELQVDRLRALGLGPGKDYGRLKDGQTVVLPDGRLVVGSDFLGESRPGRIVAITGDTSPTLRTVELAREADVLVHESTYAATEADMAPRYTHSTCVDAAHIGAQAGVGRLLLTHVSQRYGDADLDQMQEQAREVFPQSYVMRDLQTVDLPLRR